MPAISNTADRDGTGAKTVSASKRIAIGVAVENNGPPSEDLLAESTSISSAIAVNSIASVARSLALAVGFEAASVSSCARAKRVDTDVNAVSA